MMKLLLRSLRWGIAIGALFLFSCLSSPKEELPKDRYFDIDQYIEQEITHWDSLQPPVVKRAVLNGKEEVDTLSKLNWKNELKMFQEVDLNRAAWVDAYSIDTVQDSVQIIRYRAQREDLPVKQLTLGWDTQQKELQWLKAKRVEDNLIYQSTHHYKYFPGRYYSIEAQQSILLLGENTFDMHSRFITP